jgi:hypothetical protein
MYASEIFITVAVDLLEAFLKSKKKQPIDKFVESFVTGIAPSPPKKSKVRKTVPRHTHEPGQISNECPLCISHGPSFEIPMYDVIKG